MRYFIIFCFIIYNLLSYTAAESAIKKKVYKKVEKVQYNNKKYISKKYNSNKKTSIKKNYQNRKPQNVKAQNVKKNENINKNNVVKEVIDKDKIEDKNDADKKDNVQISVSQEESPKKPLINLDNPRNNTPFNSKEDKGKKDDKLDFSLEQFTEIEKDVMQYIEKENIDEIKKNQDIILNNNKISLFMFIKANELRGTLKNGIGIQMMQILLERHYNDYILLASLGIAYYENNEFFKAKELLEEALDKLNRQSFHSNQGAVGQIKQILSRVQDGIRDIKGDFSIGYGYDDNPLYLSNASIISIFNLQLQNSPVRSDFMMNTGGVLNYHYFFNDNIGGIGYFSANFNLYNKTGSRNMITLSLGDGLSFKYKKFRIDVLGNYNSIWLGGNAIIGNEYFLRSYGATVNISYTFNRYIKTSVFFNYYRKEFAILPERNSNLFSTGLSVSFNPFYYTFINFSIGNNFEMASLNAYSNNTFFTSIVINQILNKYFSVTASLFYARSNYANIDPLVWITRHEDALLFQASLNYHITANFILSLVYKRVQNISNTALYNYSRNYYYASFGFRF